MLLELPPDPIVSGSARARLMPLELPPVLLQQNTMHYFISLLLRDWYVDSHNIIGTLECNIIGNATQEWMDFLYIITFFEIVLLVVTTLWELWNFSQWIRDMWFTIGLRVRNMWITIYVNLSWDTLEHFRMEQVQCQCEQYVLQKDTERVTLHTFTSKYEYASLYMNKIVQILPYVLLYNISTSRSSH